jgi:hypothetical protein
MCPQKFPTKSPKGGLRPHKKTRQILKRPEKGPSAPKSSAKLRSQMLPPDDHSSKTAFIPLLNSLTFKNSTKKFFEKSSKRMSK